MSTIWTELLGAEVRYRGRKYRTRTIEAGTGDPLILMHGLGGHAEAYARNVRRLSQKHRVIAVDLLWHGFSSKPEVARKMIPAYVDQILDLMDDLGCARASVEGESLGGWIALEMALGHPERLRKMVLNTSYGVRLRSDAVKEDVEGGLVQLRDRSVAAISNPTREVVRKRLEWLMASPERVTDELVDIRHAIYSMPETQAALKAVFETSFDPNREDQLFEEQDLARIRTPTLVLWTDRNPGTGPDGGARLSTLIPGSEYHCIRDAAHWPQWEQAEEHDRLVLGFLDR